MTMPFLEGLGCGFLLLLALTPLTYLKGFASEQRKEQDRRHEELDTIERILKAGGRQITL